MTSYYRDGKVGQWAEEKLKCLHDYLSAYTTILRKQSSWCQGYFYIDAFAGAGRAELRASNGGKAVSDPPLLEFTNYWAGDAEEASYLDGSPYVALNIEHPFTRYIFIEKHKDRVAQLARIAEEYKGRRNIEIIQDDASCAIERVLGDTSIDWVRHRAVIFLDPFGMQVSWQTIKAIAYNRRTEIILNLPVGMTIERFLSRSGRISDDRRQKLTTYFGSSEWERVIYKQSTDLFGQLNMNKVHESDERLAYRYRDRLKEVFGFVAREPRLIRNSKGGHLYYLLFAGPNEKGAEIATHVLKQGKRVPRR